eukprot:11494380-Ditylum_brightwellii.AAC.1
MQLFFIVESTHPLDIPNGPMVRVEETFSGHSDHTNVFLPVDINGVNQGTSTWSPTAPPYLPMVSLTPLLKQCSLDEQCDDGNECTIDISHAFLITSVHSIYQQFWMNPILLSHPIGFRESAVDIAMESANKHVIHEKIKCGNEQEKDVENMEDNDNANILEDTMPEILQGHFSVSKNNTPQKPLTLQELPIDAHKDALLTN